jgi:hypothetical protein
MSRPKGDFNDYLEHKDHFKRYLADDEEIRNSIKSIEHAHEALSEHHTELHDALQAVKTYEQTHKRPRHHLDHEDRTSSSEALPREANDFKDFLALDYPFQQYLRHQDTIHSMQAARHGISEHHIRLHNALHKVNAYEQQQKRRNYTLRIKPALECLEEEDATFFTQEDWAKFSVFVQSLCEQEPNWIGHVMLVDDVSHGEDRPVILCLEWHPDRENPHIRSWTGQVVVLARLVHGNVHGTSH